MEQAGIIKVAIADDHKIFRKGVILSLREYSNIKFVLEADDGQMLIDKLHQTDPDIILMDIRMPMMDGIEATKHVIENFPSIKILVLTMYEEDELVTQLIKCGANGYLLKSSSPAEINKAICDIMRTGFYLDYYVNRMLEKKKKSKRKIEPGVYANTGLSELDKAILKLICLEYTVEQIAEKMNLSVRTVMAVRERLKGRFGSL